MIQINLIPDVKKDHIKAVQQKKVIISASLISSGVFLGVVLLLALAVFGVQKKTISDLSGDIEEKIGQLKGVEDLDKVLTIQNQLTALPELYLSRPNGNNLFKYLSVITPDDINLSSTQVTFSESAESGEAATMEISGTTKLFKDANRFADIIKNAQFYVKDSATGEELRGDAFSSVVMLSLAKTDDPDSDTETTSFSITMQYDAAIFDIKYDTAKLTVPNITSSVSSTEKPNFNPKPFGEEGGE